MKEKLNEGNLYYKYKEVFDYYKMEYKDFVNFCLETLKEILPKLKRVEIKLLQEDSDEKMRNEKSQIIELICLYLKKYKQKLDPYGDVTLYVI